MSKIHEPKVRNQFVSFLSIYLILGSSLFTHAQVVQDGADFSPWWESPNAGVIQPGAVENNAAVVTLGQVKNIVTQAVSYFDGLGYDTSELLLSDNVSLPDAIAGWDRDPEVNALVATVGQVKNHAEPFWRYLITNELLSSEGQLYTEADIPWTLNDASDDNNLAVATIGQVKNAFAFALALGEHNFDNGILDELEEVNNATQLTGEERFLPLEPFVTHAPEALGAEVLPGSSSLNLVIPEFAPTPPSTVSLEEEEGIEFALEKEGANVLNTFPNVASVNATLYSDGSLKHEFAYDGDRIEVHEIDDLRYIELNGTDSGVGFYREFTLAPGDILEGGITSVGREDIEPDTFYNLTITNVTHPGMEEDSGLDEAASLEGIVEIAEEEVLDFLDIAIDSESESDALTHEFTSIEGEERRHGFQLDNFSESMVSFRLNFIPSDLDNTSGTRIRLDFTVSSDEPVPEISAGLNYEEMSGSRYRKIGLNGRPISDVRPQLDGESDMEPEETYIDALNLDLVHSFTDVYVPVPASDLTLTVRRNAVPTTWNDYNGMTPLENPTNVFGPGWSSNLASYVVFNEQVFDVNGVAQDRDGDGNAGVGSFRSDTVFGELIAFYDNVYREVNGISQQSPNTVTVVDENGASFNFAISYEGATRVFVPLASDKTQQSAYLNTLVEETDGSLTFRKKYGNTLSFDGGPVRTITSNRVFGSSTYTRMTYNRLNAVSDRMGNTVEYTYDSDLLVPSKISVPNSNKTEDEELSIRISHDALGRVSAVQDPNGNLYTYQYDQEFELENNLGIEVVLGEERLTGIEGSTPISHTGNLLGTVRRGGIVYSRYKYDSVIQQDQKRSNFTGGTDLRARTGETGILSYDVDFYHLNLAKIIDADANEVRFEYEFDHSREEFITIPANEDELLPEISGHANVMGLPRNVTSISLPGVGSTRRVTTITGTHEVQYGVEETTHTPDLFIPNINVDERHTTVTDAVGNRTIYTWVAPQTFTSTDEVCITILNPDMFNYLDEDSTHRTLIGFVGMKNLELAFEDSLGNLVGTQSIVYNENAGFEPSIVRDFSGNETTFEYNTPVAGNASYNRGVGQHPHFNGVAAVGVGFDFGLMGELIPSPIVFSDPDAQIDAIGGRREYTYGSHRKKSSIVDEEGRTTTYEVDLLGRRTSETVRGEDGIVSITDFGYDHPDFPGFMTSRVRRSEGTALSSNDPSWVGDLATVYVANSDGRVASEIVILNTDSLPDNLFGYTPSSEDLVTEYTYDRNGNKITIVDPRGYEMAFEYDRLNRLTKTFYQDGTTKECFYDGRSNKIREVDENGIASIFEYDASSRLIRTTREMSTVPDITTRIAYNDVDSPVRSTDARGYISVTEYDAIQRPFRIITPQGDTAAGVIPTVNNGYVTTMEYDINDNTGGSVFNLDAFKPTRLVEPRGFEVLQSYDGLYRPTVTLSQYQEEGEDLYTKSTQRYDAVGNVLISNSFRNPHDRTGDPIGSVQQLSTTTIYDALNRPVEVIKASNTSISSKATTSYTSTGFSYQSSEEITDGVFRVSSSEYDRAGRMSRALAPSVFDALSGTNKRPESITEYDKNSNVVSTTNPLGNTWETRFDSRNRPVQAIQPAVLDSITGAEIQPVITTEYDDVGNVVAVTDARLFRSTTEYDDAYRVTRTTTPEVFINGASTPQALTTSQTYDASSNVISVTDPNGNVTFNTYDALNRLTVTKTNPTVPASASNHPDDITVVNEYDEVNNLLSVTDGESQVTAFTYDGLNRKLKTVWDPNSSRERIEETLYDALVVTEMRYPNQEGETTMEYEYDARFRASRVLCPTRPADNKSFTYDLADRKLTVTHFNFEDTTRDCTYVYDDLDRITSETSATVPHTTDYDLAGNTINTTYGSNGTSLRSTYDRLNRLTSITERGSNRTEYQYDLGGNITEKILPSGQTCFKGFDALGRKTFVCTGTGNSFINSFEYQYDGNGNVLNIDESYANIPSRIVANSYDRLNRLTSETIIDDQSVITTYEYDDANNRITKDVLGGEDTGLTTYTFATAQPVDGEVYNSNQLVSYTKPSGEVITFTYDPNGNRVTKHIDGALNQTYTYDPSNRLLEVDDVVRGIFTYEYDARTRRVLRDESLVDPNAEAASPTNGLKTRLSFHLGTSVQEFDGTATTPDVEYIRGSDYGGGIGGILYTYNKGQVSYNAYNSRGDVVTKTDDSGAVTWEASYEAFGTRTAEEGENNDRQRGNTKDEDSWGGLNEGFRYRDLEAGVWLTRDPAGFVDGPNVYTYVNQNPWTMFDPLGLRAEKEQETAELGKIDKEVEKYNEIINNKESTIDEVKKAKEMSTSLSNSAKNLRMIIDAMTDGSPDISKIISGAEAPWLRSALGEIGDATIQEWDKGWNPQIKKYQMSTETPKFFNDDSTGYNAWCAAFCNWALESVGVPGPIGGTPSTKYSSIRAWSPHSKNGKGFGEYGIAGNLKNPAMGSLGITGNKGFNHVGIILGTQEGRFVMIGGNQDDRLTMATKFHSEDRRVRHPSGQPLGPTGVKFKSGSFTTTKNTR